MKNNYPLEAILPHANPMILISQVTDYDLNLRTLNANVTIKQQDIFYQENIEGVPSLVSVEYMAQSIAAFAGIHDLSIDPNATPLVGFLIGTRKLKLLTDIFQLDSTYFIAIEQIFFDGNMASFDCKMTDTQNNLVASATINTYRPDNIDEFIRNMHA